MAFVTLALCIVIIIVAVQLTYSYLTLSKLTCPDCPECPTYDDRAEIPSTQSIVTYINNKFIVSLTDDVNSINYLKFNVIFANNYIINFQAEAESVISKIRNEFENKKTLFTADNLVYVQSNDENTRNKFILNYNLPQYPTPLIYFNDSNLLFGNIQNEWKILLDITKI